MNQKVKINLIEVSEKNEHIEFLYGLLKMKDYSISHKKMPSRAEHELFMKSNPYRAWYIIEQDKVFLGSIYLLENNIGITLRKSDPAVLKASINEFLEGHFPLEPIPSIRPSNFTFNVNPCNKELIKVLKSLGASKVQESYSLK